jgi:hypothetical protein
LAITDSVEVELKALEAMNAGHMEIGLYMARADGGTMYPIDTFALAVLHRSMSLIRGFCDSVRSENYLCAAPLVRLQLDNLLRMYALFIAHDPHEVAFRAFAGVPIRKQKDRAGNKMIDQYLVKKLSVDLPWVGRVYEETSGFIHLSEKHIFSTHGSIDRNKREVRICVSGRDFSIPDAARMEAAKCMSAITFQVLRYVYGWAHTKDVVGASKLGKVTGD